MVKQTAACTGKYLLLSLWLGLAAAGACGMLAEPSAGSAAEPTQDRQWWHWRGPRGTGVAPHADPPSSWSEDKNLAWKQPIPGRGHSTPIVVGDYIFLTAAVATGPRLKPQPDTAPGAHDNLLISQRHKFVVMALHKKSGKVAWEKAVHETLPHEGGHNTGSLASASPISDGERIFAFFGSYGLYCFDLRGTLLWQRQLGRMRSKHGHGEGSSPALAGDRLIVNWDHEGQSFIVALDKMTGKQIWRKDRSEVTSWSTPIVVRHNRRDQVIVPGTSRVRSYDTQDGTIIWQCGGLSANIVASPVSGDGMVYVGSSYEKRAFLAIKLEGASGDITGSKQVVWQRVRGTPYVPSPLLYGDGLYYLTHYQGILTRLRAATGEDAPGAIRLGALRNIYASPIGASNRVYITDRDGVTMVITHSVTPRLISVNRLDDSVSASLAIAGDAIFLRGEKNLYCIRSPLP